MDGNPFGTPAAGTPTLGGPRPNAVPPHLALAAGAPSTSPAASTQAGAVRFYAAAPQHPLAAGAPPHHPLAAGAAPSPAAGAPGGAAPPVAVAAAPRTLADYVSEY